MILSSIVDGKWAPERPEDYVEACGAGARYADEMIGVIRDTQNPTILGSVMQAIADSAEFGGVEIGFYTRVAVVLMKR